MGSKIGIVRLTGCVFALAAVLVTDVCAEMSPTGTSVAAPRDMRLWSFGDCDRQFPYVNSAERKECVRVVGSAEAKDARALKTCEISHEKDPEEIQRCTADYQARKEQTARDGAFSNAPGAAQAELSPEMAKRVRAISSAVIEEKKAAAAAAAAEADPEEPQAPSGAAPESSSTTYLGLIAIAALVLGFGAMRRKQAKAGSVAPR